MEFSHIYGPDGLNNTLLYKAVSLETAPTVRTEECILQGPGREWGASDCPGPPCGSTSSHILSMTSNNNRAREWGIW